MIELSRAAVHESAHLAVAVLCGLQAQASLVPPECWVREPNGHREVRAHVCCALAGAIVDERFEFHATEPTGDKIRAAELIDAMYSDIPDELDRSAAYWDRLAMQTDLLLEKHWPAILTLAEELMRTGTVSGRRAREIVFSASPSVTAAPPRRPTDWPRIFAEIARPYTIGRSTPRD
jgi:hypothetical protein